MKIRNASNFKLTPADVESGGGLSMTVPDESMSVRTILEKFSRGMDPGLSKDPVYGDENFDSPDMEKLRDSDLVDKEEFAQHLATTNAATEKSLNETIAKQKAAQDAAAKKAAKRTAALDKLLEKDDKPATEDDDAAL